MKIQERIRVLVVDDSAFARKVIREVLTTDPEIEVIGIARDGLEALEKIAELKPDVVTLDLVMPDLDGLGVLRTYAKKDGPRFVIVSVSGSNTELGIEALFHGAVDVVMKPTPLPTDRLYELSDELIRKVKSAALAQAANLFDVKENVSQSLSKLSLPGAGRVRADLVVVGTSTGGPQALVQLFRDLPAGFPAPVAVALHIPAGYTAPLAARMTALGGIPMQEAEDGMELLPGRAVIAPGGYHLKIELRGGRYFANVSREPRDATFHPSVDILFESAARAAGSGTIGIILTGMGNDGAKGAQVIRNSGGRVFAESASSCVIYGMPRTVIEAGLANEQAPVNRMAELILKQMNLDCEPQ